MLTLEIDEIYHKTVSLPLRVRICKRLMDVVLSLLFLILFGPIMLLIAIGIKLTSPGPIFYKQRRLSRCLSADSLDHLITLNKEDEFAVYKFRTMPCDVEKNGAVISRVGDNRATCFGKILRKTRLDELPQFINVLKGDMSIVGPRPERYEINKMLESRFPIVWSRSLFVKPGITGLAQIKLRADGSIGEKDELSDAISEEEKGKNDDIVRYKLYYDATYMMNMVSFWTFLKQDIIIILKTPYTMFFKKMV